jgi:23S rRNA (uracil1939-C5)-methyltransferase
VQVQVHRRKNNWEQATLTRCGARDRRRVVPRCGTSASAAVAKMPHLHVGAQVATKQRALEDALWHLGKVKAERLLRPTRRAELGLSLPGQAVGAFSREEGQGAGRLPRAQVEFVADMDSCEVLPPQRERDAAAAAR